MNKDYTIDDIESLSFKDGVRTRIQMYLGSDDNEGTYQAFKEIINNSTDEALAGFGDKIEISVNEKNNSLRIRDYGRGVPLELVKTERTFLFLSILNPTLVVNLTIKFIKTRQVLTA